MDGSRKVCVPDDAPRSETVAKFVSAPVRAAEPALAPGERLPGNALTVIGTDYLGLPPAQDGWAYFRVGRDIYKADFYTRRIIGQVSP